MSDLAELAYLGDGLAICDTWYLCIFTERGGRKERVHLGPPQDAPAEVQRRTAVEPDDDEGGP